MPMVLVNVIDGPRRALVDQQTGFPIRAVTPKPKSRPPWIPRLRYATRGMTVVSLRYTGRLGVSLFYARPDRVTASDSSPAQPGHSPPPAQGLSGGGQGR